MRRTLGLLMLAPAVVVVLAGAALAYVLGPDCRATTGPHAVDKPGIAVVTRPDVISWAGATVSVVAEVPRSKPVFVGLANSVDLEDYLRDTAHLEVESYRVPWTVNTAQVSGRDRLAASPTALDWWLADSAGLGGAALTVALPDDTVSLAILAVGDTDLSGLRVTTSYDLPGGFGAGLGLVGIGLGLGLLGWVVLRSAREQWWAEDDEDGSDVGGLDGDGSDEDGPDESGDGVDAHPDDAVRSRPIGAPAWVRWRR